MYTNDMLKRHAMLCKVAPYPGERWFAYSLVRGETTSNVVPQNGLFSTYATGVTLQASGEGMDFNVGSRVRASLSGMYTVSLAPGVQTGQTLYLWTAETGGTTYTVKAYTLGARTVVSAPAGTYPDNGQRSGVFYLKI